MARRKKLRKRNPSRRSRLTPAEKGEFYAREENLIEFTKFATQTLLDGGRILDCIFEGRQWELSWSQIRKGVRTAVARLIEHARHKMK